MSSTVQEPVLFSVEDGIAHIKLNRPERRNALSVATSNRLRELWDIVDEDKDVRVVVLDAAECGTFCAGMDLKEAAEIKQKTGEDILGLIKDPFLERMRLVQKPIIAALTGQFTAGGMMLALNSDLRVGVRGTTGGIAEARRGRGSPWAVPLAWMVSLPVAMEMILTGEPVTVERLYDLGFINHVEPTVDAARNKAFGLARLIAGNAPLSVYAGKKSLMRAIDLGCERGLVEAKDIHKVVYESNDAQEGPRAFLEKRKPQWTGT